MRTLVLIGLLYLAMLSLAARGPHKSFEPSPESVLIWSAATIIGPVYYPALAPVDSPTRQVAEDLARILGKAAGCDWPVGPEPAGLTMNGIYVGDTVRARLDGVYGTRNGRAATATPPPELLESVDWERTEVLVHPKRLVINGISASTTRIGVYRFLQESLGCVWAQAGEDGEFIPSPERFALPAGRRYYQPAFKDRQFLLGGNLDPENEAALWALRNGASRHFEFNHNLFRIFTQRVMAEQEDWRAWRFGERAMLGDVHASGSQPDLLNPEVVNFTVEYVKERMEAMKRPLTVSVSTNDSIRYDDSTATRDFLQPWKYFRMKPNYSDLVFDFTNEVAAHTDGIESPYITQLAYQWTEQPPSFLVHERVMPYLCTDQSQWYDPQYRAEDEALFAAWSEAGPRMIGAWEYYQGQPYIIPRYFPTMMAESLDWLADHRVQGIFFSGRPLQGYDDSKYWLAGQLGWQPDADHQRLLSHYFETVYGPAAEPMAAFFSECEEAWMSQPGQGLWLKYWNNPDQLALFSPERRAAMSQHLEQAIVLANDTHAQAFIEETRAAWAVTDRAADLYDAWSAIPYPGEEAPTQAQWDAFAGAQTVWQEGDRTPFTHSGGLLKKLDDLSPVARWQTGYQVVALEDFDEAVFMGDLEGAGPETLSPDLYLNHWATVYSHAESMSIRRILSPEPHLDIRGADYFKLTRRFGTQRGLLGRFRLEAQLRGQVSPGSQVVVQFYFIDTENKILPPHGTDRLRPGHYEETVILAVDLPIPTEAVSLGVSVAILNQFPEDWLAIDALELQFESIITDARLGLNDRQISFPLAPTGHPLEGKTLDLTLSKPK